MMNTGETYEDQLELWAEERGLSPRDPGTRARYERWLDAEESADVERRAEDRVRG